MKDYITEQITLSVNTKNAMLTDSSILAKIENMARIMVDALRKGKKILLFGNGGSASDAQHIATELVARFEQNRLALPAIALNCNTSNLTAIGNDFGFVRVFSRQVEALGNEGDIALGISTSGTSQNVIEAFRIALQKKMVLLGFAGQKMTLMDELCEEIIHVPSPQTARIQECHIMVAHILCGLIEQAFSEGN